MWILGSAGVAILLCILAIDFRIRRRPGRKIDIHLSKITLLLSLVLLLVSFFWIPAAIAGTLLALVCANAFIVHQRSKSLFEIAKMKNTGTGQAPFVEAPYEQFISTFFSYFDRGEADMLEFEFRRWRMEIRFKKAETPIPVTDTPFHMLLQIKRLFDAATARNPKTGESKMRYVSRGILYEFLSEDIGGTLLRLRLIEKRPASAQERDLFDRAMDSVR